MTTQNQGQAFSPELSKQVRARFYHVDVDPTRDEARLYFENAGGAVRLKAAHKTFLEIDALPDCPERTHKTALYLQEVQEKGIDDIRTIFNAKGGAIVTNLTASQAMFDVVRAIAENTPGKNIVTTALEHPSAFDAAKMYAERLGLEFRIAATNPLTGGVDAAEVARHVDADTCLISVIYASNISGAVVDIEAVVRECRKKKPDLMIVVDAVQHAPHGLIDLQKTPVDAINFAPYKFFGVRGFGVAWVSDRVATLPHHKLLGKPADEWELGSPAPAHFGVITEIVNHVCWIGSQYADKTDRRELFAEGMHRITLHERALMHRLLTGFDAIEGLRNMKGVKVFLDYEDLSTRDLILAIGFDNLGYTQAVKEYEKHGVLVYERVATSIYSKRLLESFGMDGSVRVTPLHCHDFADVDRFLRITRQMAHG
jgi:selenocysteine lyase/cysteine desulfurase